MAKHVVDLEYTYLKSALQAALASVKRGRDKVLNPNFQQIVEQDIAIFEKAIASITPFTK